MKKLHNSSLPASMSLTAQGSVSTLGLKTFNPGPEAIFPVTSTLIYGEHDAVLVDAQFQKQYAAQVAELIKASGKNLKYIFISHSDPDYYFGLDEIKKAFPHARVVSTAQTAWLISASKEAKMAVWKDSLGKDAPGTLDVPAAVNTGRLMIDGQSIEIIQDESDPAYSYLWLPSLKTILGGIPVSEGGHLWMADTRTVQDIDLWIARIDGMKALQPERVIPGHHIKSDLSPAVLDFVRQYLLDYRNAATPHHNAEHIIAEMDKRYPTLPGRPSLEFGAGVFAGEVPWHVTALYPPVGKIAEVKFGDTLFELRFTDHRTMSFEGLSGTFRGVKDTVEYTAVEVGQGIFMVYWHEPHTGSDVVHVQNWNTGKVWTNIAGKDGSFSHLEGKIQLK